MVDSVPHILARIVERKRSELDEAIIGRDQLEHRAEALSPVRRDFVAALRSRPRAIIAEIKKASPSKGVLIDDFHPDWIARKYEAGGAACLSVLTDRDFFRGSLADMDLARSAVGLPALRKDFTTSEYHVVEAAAHGADAILLIAAILDVHQLRSFRQLAEHYRMAALVEVHDEGELERALDSGATLIGVNNRDLRTFEVTLETSLRLARTIPDSVVRVAESGIHTVSDIAALESAGFHAFLVGEHLMKAPDPKTALELLLA